MRATTISARKTNLTGVLFISFPLFWGKVSSYGLEQVADVSQCNYATGEQCPYESALHCSALHFPPRAAGVLRSYNAATIWRSDVAPSTVHSDHLQAQPPPGMAARQRRQRIEQVKAKPSSSWSPPTLSPCRPSCSCTGFGGRCRTPAQVRPCSLRQWHVCAIQRLFHPST